MIGHMSTRSRTSRLAMRTSPRMTASARTALAWLRSGRVSSVLAGLLMLITAALAAVGHVSPLRISDNPLAADLSHPLHLWSLLTAWAGATHLSPLTGVVTLLTVGIALERTSSAPGASSCPPSSPTPSAAASPWSPTRSSAPSPPPGAT